MIDPARADDVAEALDRYVRTRFGDGVRLLEPPSPIGRGFASFIYAFRLAGDALPREWRAPLVVRLLLSPESRPVLEREDAMLRFLGERRYPVLAPLAVEPAGASVGLPFAVVPRAMGGTLLERGLRRPLAIPRMLRSMGEAHASLHHLAIDGWPLPYDAPLVDRRIADWRARLDLAESAPLRRALGWLEQHADRVRSEAPAICHGDFHPLNLLVRDDGGLFVIDWTDATLGDRHSDVARTATLLWFAHVAATSTAERLLLKGVRGFMRRRYLAAYRRELPVDPVRFRYWEAANAFNGWLQLAELRARGPDAPEAQIEMVRQMTHHVADEIERFFWRHAD
jgi:aminoglycoside phosphotransferase (APT) family kinase protein